MSASHIDQLADRFTVLQNVVRLVVGMQAVS
jgi:hypothetical protein